MKLMLHLPSALAGAAGLGLILGLTSMMQAGGKLQRVRKLTPEQEEIFSHLSLVHLPDGNGGTVKTIRLSAADLQLVNGLGATNGLPSDPFSIQPTATRTNGVGNVFVGYLEVAGVEPTPFRTGSHNLVTGQEIGCFDKWGCLIGGHDNVVLSPFSSIVGGEDNRSEAPFAAILGGRGNQDGPIGCLTTVAAGADNRVNAPHSSIGGGQSGSALAEYTAVGGGLRTLVPGVHDWAAGGLFEEQ